MAGTTAVATWPTIERVEEILAAVKVSRDAIERFRLDCYGLTSSPLDSPYEPVEGVCEPTLEEVGALATLVSIVGDELLFQQGELEQLRELLNVSAYRAADGRKAVA